MTRLRPTRGEAEQRLPLAWDQYQRARARLSVATAAYLRAKRLVKLLLTALGKTPPPGPWHKGGRGGRAADPRREPNGSNGEMEGGG